MREDAEHQKVLLSHPLEHIPIRAHSPSPSRKLFLSASPPHSHLDLCCLYGKLGNLSSISRVLYLLISPSRAGTMNSNPSQPRRTFSRKVFLLTGRTTHTAENLQPRQARLRRTEFKSRRYVFNPNGNGNTREDEPMSLLSLFTTDTGPIGVGKILKDGKVLGLGIG